MPAPTWVLNRATDWTGLSRTNNPGVAGSTLDSGNWVDYQGLIWFTAGGCLPTIVIDTPGTGYTGTPTASLAASTGTSARKTAASFSLKQTAGAVSFNAWTNNGRDYPTAPAVTVNGTGSGATAHATDSGNMLEAPSSISGTGAPYGNFGAQGWLCQATGQEAAAERIDIRGIFTGSNDRIACSARLNPANATLYSCVCRTGQVDIYPFENYQGVGSVTPLLTQSFAAATLGDTVEVSFRVYGTFPTSISVKITNVTTSTVLYDNTSSPITDSTASLQVAGLLGTGLSGNGAAITSMTTYLGQSFTADTPLIPLLAPALVVSLTGVATAWDGSTVFTLSGATTATLASYNVIDATHATITIYSGSTLESFNVSDGTLTAPLTTQAISLGAATSANLTPAGVTIGSPAALYANANDTYVLYRGTLADFLYNDAGVTTIGTRSGVGSGVAPTSFTDTPASGTWYYRWRVTDSTSQVVSGASVGVVMDSLFAGAIQYIGDSEVVGATGATVLTRWAADTVVTAGGSGYNGGTVTAAVTGGVAVRAATLGLTVSGGVITSIYVTDPGEYSTAPTGISIDGHGSGSGATATIVGGGGACLGLQLALTQMNSLALVPILDAGHNGATTATFAPGTQYDIRANAQAAAQGNVKVVAIRLGVNDATAGTTAAAYKTAMLAIINPRIASGFKVAISQPICRPAASETANSLIQQYQTANLEIQAANPANITVIPNQNFPSFLANNWLYYTDQVHPNDVGYMLLGVSEAPTLARLINLSIPNYPNSRPSTLTSSGLVG